MSEKFLEFKKSNHKWKSFCRAQWGTRSAGGGIILILVELKKWCNIRKYNIVETLFKENTSHTQKNLIFKYDFTLE